MPPSIGIQGGGQQPGSSVGGGGGGGKASETLVIPKIKINKYKCFLFIDDD